MTTFSVTYEIVTEESAAEGDAFERGYVAENISLRKAIDYLFATRTNAVDSGGGVHANESPMRAPRWVTVNNGMEFETGDYESRSLHFPKHLTAATCCRIARLLGAS